MVLNPTMMSDYELRLHCAGQQTVGQNGLEARARPAGRCRFGQGQALAGVGRLGPAGKCCGAATKRASNRLRLADRPSAPCSGRGSPQAGSLSKAVSRSALWPTTTMTSHSVARLASAEICTNGNASRQVSTALGSAHKRSCCLPAPISTREDSTSALSLSMEHWAGGQPSSQSASGREGRRNSWPARNLSHLEAVARTAEHAAIGSTDATAGRAGRRSGGHCGCGHS